MNSEYAYRISREPVPIGTATAKGVARDRFIQRVLIQQQTISRGTASASFPFGSSKPTRARSLHPFHEINFTRDATRFRRVSGYRQRKSIVPSDLYVRVKRDVERKLYAPRIKIIVVIISLRNCKLVLEMFFRLIAVLSIILRPKGFLPSPMNTSFASFDRRFIRCLRTKIRE